MKPIQTVFQMMLAVGISVVLVGCGGQSGGSSNGWRTASLSTNSTGAGIVDGVSYPFAVGQISNEAVYWNLQTGEARLLNSGGQSTAAAKATNGTAFIGVIGTDPAYWPTSSSTPTNLMPPGYESGEVTCMNDNLQGGYLFDSSSNPIAVIWTGTAGSILPLDHGTYTRSSVKAIDGTDIVGVLSGNGAVVGALWTGQTHELTVITGPGGGQTLITAASDGYQYGYCTIGGQSHAAVWHGTSETFQDLSVGSTSDAFVSGAAGNWAVGYVSISGDAFHAYAWNRSTGAQIDLHSLLAGNFSSSGARAVTLTGNQVVIVGTATSATTHKDKPVSWTFSGS